MAEDLSYGPRTLQTTKGPNRPFGIPRSALEWPGVPLYSLNIGNYLLSILCNFV